LDLDDSDENIEPPLGPTIARPRERPTPESLIPPTKKSVEFLHLTVQKYTTGDEVIASKASMATNTDPNLGIQPSACFLACLVGILKLIHSDQLFRTLRISDKRVSPFLRYVRRKFGEHQRTDLPYSIASFLLLKFFAFAI
jgi:hypothetical protein